MLNVVIVAALAGGPAASVPYADCLLGNIQPGLSDHAVQLVQQACAAKHPDSFLASLELERTYSVQRQARFDADRAAAERAANAAASAAQAAAERDTARAQGAKAK
ncbi:hypothetical protein [uncultured Stenotrophomonas sp.]|uniref:hypothetical protein n=1 Tax=uncultured Stenotrophomonas sp. TaxID=165438 RepID=UPI0025DBF417|nr:hypothetical protein [uncultured Stenotrophomonas sp.]